jgi:hypothetical protein
LALPLGELSPQVTERVLQTVLYDEVNLCANAPEIPVDLPIGESQHLQTKISQKFGSFRIICHATVLIMLRAIHFNDESGRSTVKVHDKSAYNPLFVNLQRIFAEEEIP